MNFESANDISQKRELWKQVKIFRESVDILLKINCITSKKTLSLKYFLYLRHSKNNFKVSKFKFWVAIFL